MLVLHQAVLLRQEQPEADRIRSRTYRGTQIIQPDECLPGHRRKPDTHCWSSLQKNKNFLINLQGGTKIIVPPTGVEK
jgi:hypothetical protein